MIALAALFVSWLGWAAPARMDESFTWASLPTLHAEFVGALYAFGGVYMACCVGARYRRQVAPAIPAVIIFTGLLLASFAHRDLFSGKDVVTWLWFAWFAASTLAFALLSLAVLTRGRTGATPVAT